jgi:hypothetical protein
MKTGPDALGTAENESGSAKHRRLISKVIGVELDASPTNLDGFNCEFVTIESLNGVFADPFELQRLVGRKGVHLDGTIRFNWFLTT